MPAPLDFPGPPLTIGQKHPVPGVPGQPVYTWDGEKWTTGGGAIDSVGASSSIPLVDGTGSAGVEINWSRGDHRHPTDTTRAPIDNPNFSGNPRRQSPPAGGSNDDSIATTKFVTDAVGASLVGFAPVNSPVFTGNPKAPTPIANDDTTSLATTAFVSNAIFNSSAGPGAVRYDMAQLLPAAQQLQARQNIFAAPADALAYNGIQINGGMEVNQEGVAATINAAYACDGWFLGVIGIAGGLTQDGAAAPGFPNRLYLAPTTARPSLSAGDLLIANQSIEGYRIARLGWGAANAQPITIGFWSSHTLAGTYSVAVRNGAANRSYVATYTQNVANILEYKTITVPGDTTGTWPITNGTGMQVSFAAAAGSTYVAPAANTWTAGNYIAAPGQINAAVALSTFTMLRGVIVLPGTLAPTAAQSPNAMRPYPQELEICRRYYYRGDPIVLRGTAGTAQPWANRMAAMHPVPMRATPSVNAATITLISGGTVGTFAGIQDNWSTTQFVEVNMMSTVGFTPGYAVLVSGVNGGTIWVSARL